MPYSRDRYGGIPGPLLLPLAAGQVIYGHYEETTADLQPLMSRASSISLIFLLVLTTLLNFSSLIALLLLVLVALALGYLAVSPDLGIRRVLGLSTAQRNLSVAFVVAGSLPNPNVVALVAAAEALMLVILMPVAGDFSKRARAVTAPARPHII